MDPIIIDCTPPPSNENNNQCVINVDDDTCLKMTCTDKRKKRMRLCIRRNQGVKIKMENLINGDIKCPKCESGIHASEFGCKVLTCRNHAPHFFYFCYHCKSECAGGIARCKCPFRNDSSARYKAQGLRNMRASLNPIFLDDMEDKEQDSAILKNIRRVRAVVGGIVEFERKIVLNKMTDIKVAQAKRKCLHFKLKSARKKENGELLCSRTRDDVDLSIGNIPKQNLLGQQVKYFAEGSGHISEDLNNVAVSPEAQTKDIEKRSDFSQLKINPRSTQKSPPHDSMRPSVSECTSYMTSNETEHELHQGKNREMLINLFDDGMVPTETGKHSKQTPCISKVDTICKQTHQLDPEQLVSSQSRKQLLCINQEENNCKTILSRYNPHCKDEKLIRPPISTQITSQVENYNNYQRMKEKKSKKHIDTSFWA